MKLPTKYSFSPNVFWKETIVAAVLLLIASGLTLTAQNLVVNGGFDSDSAWTVVEHTVPAVTTIDLPYTEDAPAFGDSSCVRFYVDGATEARPLIYQKLSLVAGESYRVTAAMKIDSFWGPTEYPPGPWFQLYMSDEEPPPAGTSTQDWNPNTKLINIMPWGDTFKGVDNYVDLIGVDWFMENYSGGNDFNNGNKPIYEAQGNPGDTVDVWIVLKPGMWMDPTLGGFEVLFDNIGVYQMGSVTAYATEADLTNGADLKLVLGAQSEGERAAFCPDSNSTITWTVDLPVEGDWYAWGRFMLFGEDNMANSFLLSIDGGGQDLKFGNSKINWEQWHWAGNGNRETNSPQKLDLGFLTAGEHTISLIPREPFANPGSDSVLIDVLYLTTDGTEEKMETQTPYNGVAQLIPGNIEAELFDDGGAGVAYWDADSGRAGGDEAFRPDVPHVEFGPWENPSGGNALAWVIDDEWYEYTVEVAEDNKYLMYVGFTSPDDSSLIKVSIQGQSSTIQLDATGGWTNWGETPTPVEVELTAGTKLLRIDIVKANYNLDYIRFEPKPEPPAVGNVVLNSGFEDESVWQTYSYRDNGKPDYEFGHTAATPTWGSGACLRVTVSGELTAQRAFFQPVELLAGHTYRFTGAITLLDLQPEGVTMPPGPWFQVYLSKEQPMPFSESNPDYNPSDKIVNIMPWGDCFREDIYDIDGFWESEMGCSDIASGPYFTPEEDGTYYLVLKFGMNFNEAAGFDVVVDNVMLIDMASNLLTNGGFEEEGGWETIAYRDNEKPDYEYPYTEAIPTRGTGEASLHVWVDSTNTAQRLFFQPVDLVGGNTYMASGALTLNSLYPEDFDMPPGPWFQYYLSKQMPTTGEDYNPSEKILNIMPWGECFRRDMYTIDGFWESEMGCSEYDTGPYFIPDEDGTYYVSIKFGMNFPEGTIAGYDALVDNVALFSVADDDAIVGIKQNAVADIPTSFELQQNYPNPFNPTTKINFTLNKQGLTTLKVYNILGQEVMTLVNKDLNAGSYTVNLDASNISSGVYIYRLTSGDNIQTKKMMLLK